MTQVEEPQPVTSTPSALPQQRDQQHEQQRQVISSTYSKLFKTGCCRPRPYILYKLENITFHPLYNDTMCTSM